ncbi:DUF3781 domain-containing protein [Latilactobacillus fuchuensis]|uniref:DUF3781 domain-containing protein n=1 Tax=Latilactobacillus fuchuensis TaxID=164393 RepID=UPI0020C7513F|nr:DUF3781 domain-containing protein [Latilactobacillus fuchuensis]
MMKGEKMGDNIDQTRLSIKNDLLATVCYTSLVYQRVNKKLATQFSELEIEKLVQAVINNADSIVLTGKNYYVDDYQRQISLTINAGNHRLITANQL